MNKKLLALLIGAFSYLMVASAQAGIFTLVSMQYSAEKFVPHIHYDGVVSPGDEDALIQLLNSFVHCDTDCYDAEGKSAAVLTLDSPGGSYITGLILAQTLRAARVATIVESGKSCYSACAFTFLGGTGYSTQAGIGEYIDRVVEPGAIVGFHAPYFPDKALVDAVEEVGVSGVLDETRSMISLMVEQLVDWNVDASVVSRMVDMGPGETYDLATPADLYLVRAGLPSAAVSAWQPNQSDGIRNVCIRLVALHNSIPLSAAAARVGGEYLADFGKNEFGESLSGFTIANEAPLGANHCGMAGDVAAAKASSSYDIALFAGPRIGGHFDPMFSFFNRQNGWSTAGTGGNPTKRIFQKGNMSHYFMDAQTNLTALESPAMMMSLSNKFFKLVVPDLPTHTATYEVLIEDRASRISTDGPYFIFETVGSADLFDVAQKKLQQHGVTFSHTSENETAFIRNGSYNDGSGGFSWIGFKSTSGAALIRIELIKTEPVEPFSTAEQSQINTLACSIRFGEMKLACGG